MSTYWILEDGNIREATLHEWAVWFDKLENRIVDNTQISDDVKVSTIFLGIDHGYGSGRAILFETMVFGADEDEHQQRYATLGEAKQGHYEIVQRLRDRLPIE